MRKKSRRIPRLCSLYNKPRLDWEIIEGGGRGDKCLEAGPKNGKIEFFYTDSWNNERGVGYRTKDAKLQHWKCCHCRAHVNREQQVKISPNSFFPAKVKKSAAEYFRIGSATSLHGRSAIFIPTAGPGIKSP